MRFWSTPPAAHHAVARIIGSLGLPGFKHMLLEHLSPVIPAASFSVYALVAGTPQLYMSASHGTADTTADCWRAYLAGPCHSDQTLHAAPASRTERPQLMHITALEVPPAHRAQVYDAHGMAERVSVVQHGAAQSGDGDALLAINFYRHQHQSAFEDQHLAGLSNIAAELMALVQKHITLTTPVCAAPALALAPLADAKARLQALQAQLTPRELEVCARLLQGMTQDGIAVDLGIKLPTVKTLRNRAFARLGIHFRSELFARVLQHRTHCRAIASK